LLWEEGLKPGLGLLVSTSFILFLEIRLTCLASPRFVLFHEVL